MKVTIKDVAKVAGVSIATVSHVLNRTKYVSPEIENTVIEALISTNYDMKGQTLNKRLHLEKHSLIAFVVPELDNAVYSKIAKELSRAFDVRQGYLLNIYCSEDDTEIEQALINRLLFTKQIGGIVLIPCSDNSNDYQYVMDSSVPVVFVDRQMEGPNVPQVLFDNGMAIREATDYLVKSGHESITLVTSGLNEHEQTSASLIFSSIIKSYHLTGAETNIMHVDESATEEFQFAGLSNSTTAVIAIGNMASLLVGRHLEELDIKVPEDVSFVTYNAANENTICGVKATQIVRNFKAMAEEIKQRVLGVSNGGNDGGLSFVPVELEVNKSTRVIGRGPFGEKIANPSVLEITEEERKALATGDYKVAISFHYGNDEWARLHELAMREKFDEYGIKILSVTDAHFDYKLQTTQLQGLLMQNPDAIISIPANDDEMSAIYKRLAKKTKLIFIQNMPNMFSENEYECWVSINEQENGQNIAKILKDHAKEHGKMDVGLITYGSSFFTLHERNFYVEQALSGSRYITIKAQRDFDSEEEAYDACRNMLLENPSIKGIYVSWDRPALHAINALKDLGRTDVVVATSDLDTEIAKQLFKGESLIGLSAQKPYEQGIAAANATAKALINKTIYKSIGVRPDIVRKENLMKAWSDILKRDPKELLEAVEGKTS